MCLSKERDGDIGGSLEDEAYQSSEGSRAYRGRTSYREYAHLGPAIQERPYRPMQLGEWPIHTDFLPDELEVRD